MTSNSTSPSSFRLEEHVAGKWHPASIPLPTAAADLAFRNAKRAEPTRRLRLMPAKAIDVPADSMVRGSVARFMAASIAADCRVAA